MSGHNYSAFKASITCQIVSNNNNQSFFPPGSSQSIVIQFSEPYILTINFVI